MFDVGKSCHYIFVKSIHHDRAISSSLMSVFQEIHL